MGAALASSGEKAEDCKVRKMTNRRQRAATSALAVLAAATVAASPASASCDWYVKTALEQQQRNLKLKCGFSGAEWSLDKASHTTWCSSVSPETSRTTAQKREADLTKCSAK